EPLGGLYQRQHDQVVSGRRVLDLHVLRAGAVQAYGGGVDHDVAALDLALDGAAGPHADERVSPDGDELFERAGGGPTTGAGGAGGDGTAVRETPRERDVFPLDRDLPPFRPARRDHRHAGRIARQQHVPGDVTGPTPNVVLETVVLGPARAGSPGRHVESPSHPRLGVVWRVDGTTEAGSEPGACRRASLAGIGR